MDKGQYTQFFFKKNEKQLTNRYVSFGQLINFPCDGRWEVLWIPYAYDNIYRRLTNRILISTINI